MGWGIVPEVFEPVLGLVGQRVFSCDVVHHQGGTGISVVDSVDGLEPLVPSGVPKLDLDGSVGSRDLHDLLKVVG